MFARFVTGYPEEGLASAVPRDRDPDLRPGSPEARRQRLLHILRAYHKEAAPGLARARLAIEDRWCRSTVLGGTPFIAEEALLVRLVRIVGRIPEHWLGGAGTTACSSGAGLLG